MPTALTWDSPLPLNWDAASVTWDGEVQNPNPTNPMPNDNRISASISPADMETILDNIAEIRALLPFLINLTKQERIELPKMGPASLAFDEQCADYMVSAPNLVPPFVSVSEVEKDRALRLALAEIWREAKKLCEMLDDTMMLVGSELWMADLSFYQTVRQAARRDVAGADTVYDELRPRFPGVAGDPEEGEEEEENGNDPTPPNP